MIFLIITQFYVFGYFIFLSLELSIINFQFTINLQF